MEISTDLRIALKSFVKAQPERYSLEAIAKRDAIDLLLKKKPSIAAALSKAKALEQQATLLNRRAGEIYTRTGLTRYGDDDLGIRDEKAFAKAGGVLKGVPKSWKFDELMARLAAAEPVDGRKLLSQLGIKWK